MALPYIDRMASVAERLQDALNDRGWSQGKLARATGVTQGAISQILLGKTLRSKFLPDIADVLGVSLRWLVGEDVPRDPTAPMPPRPQPPMAVVTMAVLLPPTRALARMFEALLEGIDDQATQAERALLLAERLPIGLSQLRDLLPESANPVWPIQAQEDAAEVRATLDHEPTR